MLKEKDMEPKTRANALKQRIKKALEKYQAKKPRARAEGWKRTWNGMDLLLLLMLLGWAVGAILAVI